jgi:WD40 repeat protein
VELSNLLRANDSQSGSPERLRRLRRPPNLHTEFVFCVAFGPDGKHLATASQDGTVQVYALDLSELLSRVTRPFTAGECRRYFQYATCPPLP